MKRHPIADAKRAQRSEVRVLLVSGRAMHLNSLAEQQVGQIGAVLTRNTKNQRPAIA